MSATATKVDLHCHSTASQTSKLGIQRSLGIPECATAPEEVYELAKRRGMQFVTITDHDTIDGCLELSDRADVFISEELTARFRGEPQAVHVLCFGLTPDDHAALQERRGDVEACAAYLHANDIVCALAHPYFAVEAPLTARHRRVLAQLFPIWETRNGTRPREHNALAQSYIDVSGGTAIGGSDDHAGVDIGKTFTQTPLAETPEEFLAQLKSGNASPGGEHGSPAKWAHAALALATRSLDCDANGTKLSAESCLQLVSGIVDEGTQRRTPETDLDRKHAAKLLATWHQSVGLKPGDMELITNLQSDELSHADLYRRACRTHERRVKEAVSALTDWLQSGFSSSAASRDAQASAGALAQVVLGACTPALPYAPAEVFVAREQSKLRDSFRGAFRVGLVVEGIGQMHGVTRTVAELRDRGVPGAEVDVIGTDAAVDQRLPSAIDVDVPFYDGLTLGFPTVNAVVDVLVEGDYDLVHLSAPGPANLVAAVVAKVMGLPCVGSYHTELTDYTVLRSQNPALGKLMETVLGHLYGACEVVLSPSPSADSSLEGLGVDSSRILRWDRGVDLNRFGPSRRKHLDAPGTLRVLYAGRLAKEKGTDLLTDAFLAAHARNEGLHLLLAGGGPEEGHLRGRLGDAATFLGWLDHDELAEVYASADMFVFASTTDTFGQVILEAQASGLPVIAVAAGGPKSLIRHGITGLLCPPEASALTSQIEFLATHPEVRERLSAAGIDHARARTWEQALRQLAVGYRLACQTESDHSLSYVA